MLDALRQALRGRHQSRNPLLRHAVTALGAAYDLTLVAHRFLTDGQYRSIARLRLLNGRALHQTTPLTWLDRYPKIFTTCREQLGDGAHLRLLSFGCSTGEEVVTLRRYFPQARIVGAEINAESLAACRKLTVDDRITFVESAPARIGALGPFDAIFCMAVLQRTPHGVQQQGITDLSRIYPFGKFDEQVRELDGWLRPGGLLVVHHTQYRVEDATVAGGYVAVACPGLGPGKGPRFDRHSRLLEPTPPSGSIFRKLAARAPVS